MRRNRRAGVEDRWTKTVRDADGNAPDATTGRAEHFQTPGPVNLGELDHPFTVAPGTRSGACSAAARAGSVSRGRSARYSGDRPIFRRPAGCGYATRRAAWVRYPAALGPRSLLGAQDKSGEVNVPRGLAG